jgi:dTDP-glucose pyrophosphorylase/predicted transcriptional regulator
MKNWEVLVISPDMRLRQAIARVDAGGRQIALVADSAGRLLGTLADGDIRRAILSGRALEETCAAVMNPRPTTAPPSAPKELLLALMRRGSFHQVPLVNTEGVLVGLITIDELLGAAPRDNWVVLMAGGQGARLRPLTQNCPKPMLRVGDSPILENILMAFLGQGFRKFFFSVNYMAEMIIDYFGDGSKWGAEIQYLREDSPLGTAGALSLLPQRPERPMFVMNGDLLTHADFLSMVQFHEGGGATATMAVREYEHRIPYGVVNASGDAIVSIEEKPRQVCLVSAGMYVLSPSALDHVPAGTFFDMPDLFRSVVAKGQKALAYPFRDYWLDIGRLEEFETAQREWPPASVLAQHGQPGSGTYG